MDGAGELWYELDRTPIATAHKEFVAKEPDGCWYYRRPVWWLKSDGSHISKAKWNSYLAALRAHPFVVVTNDDWTMSKGAVSVKRRGYICVYRIDNESLIVDDREGMYFRAVERIEYRRITGSMRL
jgi:hypothetical protein